MAPWVFLANFVSNDKVCSWCIHKRTGRDIKHAGRDIELHGERLGLNLGQRILFYHGGRESHTAFPLTSRDAWRLAKHFNQRDELSNADTRVLGDALGIPVEERATPLEYVDVKLSQEDEDAMVELLTGYGKSKDPFPVVITDALLRWMGLEDRVDRFAGAVRIGIQKGDLVPNKDFIEQPHMRLKERYVFSFSGIKYFLCRRNNVRGRQLTRAYTLVESEFLSRGGDMERMWHDVANPHFARVARAPLTQDNRGVERQISNNLARGIGGRREVRCLHGLVDILTDTHVIEVKHVENYKHAIGQVMVYGLCYPDHGRRVHLFGSKNVDTIVVLNAMNACKKLGISCSFEEFDEPENRSSKMWEYLADPAASVGTVAENKAEARGKMAFDPSVDAGMAVSYKRKSQEDPVVEPRHPGML